MLLCPKESTSISHPRSLTVEKCCCGSHISDGGRRWRTEISSIWTFKTFLLTAVGYLAMMNDFHQCLENKKNFC